MNMHCIKTGEHRLFYVHMLKNASEEEPPPKKKQATAKQNTKTQRDKNLSQAWKCD